MVVIDDRRVTLIALRSQLCLVLNLAENRRTALGERSRSSHAYITTPQLMNRSHSEQPLKDLNRQVGYAYNEVPCHKVPYTILVIVMGERLNAG